MIDNFTDIELEREQWRDVAGYDGMYQVSDLGRVRSRKSGEWKVMKGGKNSRGYLNVILRKNRKIKSITVHRLVANAFIPNNYETKNEINHKNEIKTDNRVDNLEWCDRSYNLAYNGLQQRRYHPKHKRDKVKDLYNKNLTYEQNLELLKEQGIDCSRRTLWELRKELGLVNQN